MRVTYRSAGVQEYWAKRWADIPADQPMTNHNIYPLKYAEMTVQANDGPILEAGCGAGRLLRHYKNRGFDIVGMDFIPAAVDKLKAVDPELRVEVGDITKLDYPDESFKYLLAFGLYHNLEFGLLQQALAETRRVLQPAGLVCASFRADNLQTRLTDWLAERRARRSGLNSGPQMFHKLNLTRAEFIDLFRRAGFEILGAYPVENMPILYKFAFFRARSHRVFDENKARKEGYKLGCIGGFLQKTLMRWFAPHFCNIFVIIARKAEG